MAQQLYTHSTPRRPRKQTASPTQAFFHYIGLHRRFWLLAGWGLAIPSLLFHANAYLQTSAANTKDTCQQIVQSSAVLSRAQLAKILTVPERSSQQSVKEIVTEPYCQLANLELRNGVTAKREAYPLAFEPSTWLVMLYEDNEYAGFSFRFQ